MQSYSRRRRRNPSIRREVLGAALGLGLLGLVAWYVEPEVLDPVIGRLKYGAKLGPDADKATGYVAIAPASIAAQFGIDQDDMSLGRMIRSEAGSASPAEKQAVAWVAKNTAKASGITLTQLLTRGGGDAEGYYGSQNLGGRYAATGQAARTDDIAIARKVRSGELPDNTGGALHFFNPALQDKLFASNAKKYTKNAAAVLASWAKDGFEPRSVAGTSPATFLVFVKRKALNS